MMRKLMNATLTPEEERLGFEQVWIVNEHNRFGSFSLGEPSVFVAVAHKVDESIWIFKINTPVQSGGVIYKEMQYGLLDRLEQDDPEWHPVRDANWEDPERAIESARRLPRDVQVQSVTPPQLVVNGQDRQIRHVATHVAENDIRQYEGRLVEEDGRHWISFLVRN